MNNRLILFDLMRAFAILIILFHHLPNYTGNFYNLSWIGSPLDLSPLNELNRYLGLGLFIFLAGYLLNIKRQRFCDGRSIINFLYKKFIRIFPLYYLALFIFIIIYKIFDPIKLVIHILGVQLLFASEQLEPINTLWFVGLIVIYYCLFTLLNYKNINKTYKLLIIIFFPLFIWGLQSGLQVTDFRLILYYWVFIGGVFCAETNFFESKFWRNFNLVVPALFFPILLLSFFLEKQYELITASLEKQHELITANSLYSYVLINFLMFTFVLFVYQISSLISKRKTSLKLIQLIAYASYCMFLFHRPILVVMNYIFRKTLVINVINDSIASLIILLLGIPLVIIVSNLIQRFYDEYCIKLWPRVG